MRNEGLVSENGHRKQRRRNEKLDFWKAILLNASKHSSRGSS